MAEVEELGADISSIKQEKNTVVENISKTTISTKPTPSDTQASSLTPAEKRLRALKKKKQQIEGLKEKRDQGETLEKTQVRALFC